MGLLACLRIGLLGCLLMNPFMGGADDKCPDGWLDYDGKHYCLYVYVKRCFDEAETWCNTHEGTLARISYNDVPQAVVDYLNGKSDEDIWVYDNPGSQGSASSGQVSTRYCRALDKEQGFRGYDDRPCRDELRFLCQMAEK